MYTELVLNAIEEFNIMKLGVGMPSYVASEMARAMVLRLLCLVRVQMRYLQDTIVTCNFIRIRVKMPGNILEEDVKNLYHVNLQRDDAVTMANSVELRVPYLDRYWLTPP